MKYKIILTFFLLILFFGQLSTPAKAYESSEEKGVKRWLDTHLSIGQYASSENISFQKTQVLRFYQQVGYRLVWIDSQGLSFYGNMLIRTLEYTSQQGFFLEETPPPFFRPMARMVSVQTSEGSYEREASICWDVWLTAKALHYSHQVLNGRVNPETLAQKWLASRRPMDRDIPTELAKAVSENELPAFLMSLHPKRADYVALQKALKKYHFIKDNGGWQQIAEGPTLRIGDSGPRVGALKHRLEKTADLSASSIPESKIFDEKMEEAVIRFQRRHGLKADGMVGKQTLAELNISVEKRITCLKLNMERWRWLPDSFGDRYLMVNIPAYTLKVVDRKKTIETMRVIVGKKSRKTPVMSKRMTYLEINPYWNVPRIIARKDILPQAKKDPSYLARKGIRIFESWDQHAKEVDPTEIPWEKLSRNHFPYRLRQDPSSVNALGRIKFMFPNPHSVYIHDTPGKTLFNHQERAFSSGCVRVETPEVLAHHLLDDLDWDHSRIQACIAKGKRRTLVLDHPIPVHLVYFTAWVNDEGQVNFRKDIYERDRRLLVALTKKMSNPLYCSYQAPPKDPYPPFSKVGKTL